MYILKCIFYKVYMSKSIHLYVKLIHICTYMDV